MSPSAIRLIPIAVAVLGAALVFYLRSSLPLDEVTSRLPDPKRLQELSYYLTPLAEDTTGVRERPPVLLAGDPFDAPASAGAAGGRPAVSGPAAPAPAALDVSAIFVSEGRRVAIVNQRTVRPGDELPGGARVESIEPDRVVVLDANGRRRTLRF